MMHLSRVMLLDFVILNKFRRELHNDMEYFLNISNRIVNIAHKARGVFDGANNLNKQRNLYLANL